MRREAYFTTNAASDAGCGTDLHAAAKVQAQAVLWEGARWLACA